MRFVFVCLFLAAFGGARSQEDSSPKRRYVCPANYMRLGKRCYYFGQENATWHEAYFKCQDLRGNLAIIKNPYQDKLVRQTLHRSPVPSKWWLGGLYDWEKMTWKWGASGKNLTYSAFAEPQPTNKESLIWHCISMEPSSNYRWNWESCLKQMHYICHTKLKIVATKNKKTVNPNELNEIPLPNEEEGRNRFTNLKDYKPNDEPANDLNALAAHKPKPQKRRKGKGRRNRKKRIQEVRNNGTVVYEVPTLKHGKHKKFRPRRFWSHDIKPDTSIEKLRWKTYMSGVTKSPLEPRKIVEEFVYTSN